MPLENFRVDDLLDFSSDELDLLRLIVSREKMVGLLPENHIYVFVKLSFPNSMSTVIDVEKGSYTIEEICQLVNEILTPIVEFIKLKEKDYNFSGYKKYNSVYDYYGWKAGLGL